MNKQKGLSIVELMISITLGLVLIAGVVQVFLSSKSVFITQQGMSRIQETGRLAMEFVGRDLRMASYYGCTNTINPAAANGFFLTDTISTALTGFHKDFTIGLRGYNTTSSSGTDVLPASLGTGFTPKANSDVLVIRGASERGIPVSAANNATQITGYSPETSLTNSCIEGFCSAGIAVISNCERGRFFKLSVAPVISGNTVTLTHSDTWTLTASTVPNNNYSYGNVLPVHTLVYFVATSTASSNSNSLPSLWQKTDDNAPVELLQGIEDMYITYSGDSTAGLYRRASAVTNWNKISSLRIQFLIRGLEAKSLDEVQPYIFGASSTPTTPTDNIVRQVFNATFAVRTRFN